MNDSLALTPTLDLYERLPAVYRLRDAELGYPLRDLLDAVAEQARLVKSSIDDYYEDLFVETTAEDLLPYIADLVGNQPLHPVAGRRRPDVARTLHYRRRKGTAAMLTELAQDVTGWSTWVETFFERLAWTQHLSHYRPQAAWADLRSLLACDRAQRAFDGFAHSADVRAIAMRHPRDGWHNLRNVGFFVWRLSNYELRGVPAARAAVPNTHGYHFSPLGAPLPLWSRPGAVDRVEDAPRESTVAAAIGKTAFFDDLRGYNARYGSMALSDRPDNSAYYGPERSLQVIRDGLVVPPWQVICKDLGTWARPPAGRVGIDVERGRITFAAGEEPVTGVSVHFNYGAVAPIGGGPYDRRRALSDTESRDGAAAGDVPDTVADPAALGNLIVVSGAMPTLAAALTAWSGAGAPPTVIQIPDNGVYAAPTITADGVLVIQSANQQRPLVRGPIEIRIPDVATPQRLTVVLDGLLLTGPLTVTALGAANARLVEIRLRHCTLVPGGGLDELGAPLAPAQTSITVTPARNRVRLALESCICGAVRMPEEGADFAASDTVVDALADAAYALAADAAGAAGPPAEFQRCTVLGAVHVRTLVLGSESVFTGRVAADRRQQGCLRFSYTPPNSATPRRYRCQPESAAQAAEAERLARHPGASAATLAAVRAAVLADLVPAFTSRAYGRPAYAQLSQRCALEIAEGAEGGAEMGAFHLLKQSQRATNLRLRLEEYLPFGLEAGVVRVT
jgi:hypothetical protein